MPLLYDLPSLDRKQYDDPSPPAVTSTPRALGSLSSTCAVEAYCHWSGKGHFAALDNLPRFRQSRSKVIHTSRTCGTCKSKKGALANEREPEHGFFLLALRYISDNQANAKQCWKLTKALHSCRNYRTVTPAHPKVVRHAAPCAATPSHKNPARNP
jgi:hypothetical protein